MCSEFMNDCAEGMGTKISSLYSSSRSKLPIVVVLGATGTGKSKLAIELAQKFNGEIISADSMQVYKGLDIVTNKVTAEEQAEATHHLISYTDSLKRYTVVDFQCQALPIIHNLLKKKKLPIIVGGTNYYIESLLWDVLLKNEIVNGNTLLLDVEKEQLKGEKCEREILPLPKCDSDASSSFEDARYLEDFNYTPKDLFKVQITLDSFEHIPSVVLHKVLLEVDPAKALTLHPNDKRKIIRSLQVYQRLKCRHSDLISQQKSQKGGSSLGGPLRFKNSVMLWLQCEKSVLEERLDERVDKMVESGLLTELLNFHKAYNESRLRKKQEPCYKEGIFQSIGFKEFHQYLILPEEERMSEEGEKLLKDGIEDMKLHTKQYAKRQCKWITNRFLRTPDRDLPPVYGLDATDLNLWEKSVLQIASHIVESKLQGASCHVQPLPVEEGFEDIQETNYCDICDRVFVGRRVWEIHLKSNNHYRRKASLKKKAAIANAEAAASSEVV